MSSTKINAQEPSLPSMIFCSHVRRRPYVNGPTCSIFLYIKAIMKLIMLLIIISILLPSESEAFQSQYDKERSALDAARQKKSVAALNQFISDYPHTNWMEHAIYHRDKLALDDAKAIGTVETLERFIQQYPESVWIDQAVFYRDKALYYRAQKINTKAAYTAFISEYPHSAWVEKATKSLNSFNKSKASSVVKAKTSTSSKTPTLAQQRMNRALQIYSEIDKVRRIEKREKLRKETVASRNKKICHYLKDRMKRFGERVKWYHLDDDGNRVFSSKERVEEQRKFVEEAQTIYCTG